MTERTSRGPTILRSIRTRLAVIFFAITLLAVAVIYVIIAPPLTSSLQTETVSSLKEVAGPLIAKNKHFFADLHLQDPPPAQTKANATAFAKRAEQSTSSDVTIVDVSLTVTGT